MVTEIFLAACLVTVGNIVEWDVPVGICEGGPGTPAPVAYYLVERQTVSSGTIATVGTVTEPSWNTAGDNPLPHADVAYRYRVTAYSIIGDEPATCGPSLWADACGPPMCCFEDGEEVQCYPFASLRCR
jgi:hypothetical protein